MRGLRRSLIALAILAFAIGVGAAALILSSDHSSPRGAEVALILPPAGASSAPASTPGSADPTTGSAR